MCCHRWANEDSCLGSGGHVEKKGTQATGQLSVCFTPSIHRYREWSSGFEIVGTFADIIVVCRVLGTQPLLIGALFSVDHSCDNRGLEHFINYWKIGVIWWGKASSFSSYLAFERQLLSDTSVQRVKPIWSFRV